MIVTVLFLAAGLAAYMLPWMVGPGASLTFNAYDLAEWTSLHPWVRTSMPPLVVSFILRALLMLLALLVFAVASRRWTAVLVALVALALLPPPVFFGPALADPNYRQQFALSILTLLGLFFLARLRWYWIQLVLVVLLGLGSVVAVLNSQHLMGEAFNLSTLPGPGAVCFVLITVIYGTYIYKRGQPLAPSSV